MKKIDTILCIIISSTIEMIGFIGLIILIILSTNDKMYYSDYSNHFYGFLNSKGLEMFYYTFIILIVLGLVLSLFLFFKIKKRSE